LIIYSKSINSVFCAPFLPWQRRSTPFTKQLVGQLSPLLFAGLVYIGSGAGLIITRLINGGGHLSGLVKGDWVWLMGAVGFLQRFLKIRSNILNGTVD